MLCTNIVLADCPIDCPLENDPVCGKDSDGNQYTYENTCFLGIATCNDPGDREIDSILN